MSYESGRFIAPSVRYGRKECDRQVVRGLLNQKQPNPDFVTDSKRVLRILKKRPHRPKSKVEVRQLERTMFTRSVPESEMPRPFLPPYRARPLSNTTTSSQERLIGTLRLPQRDSSPSTPPKNEVPQQRAQTSRRPRTLLMKQSYRSIDLAREALWGLHHSRCSSSQSERQTSLGYSCRNRPNSEVSNETEEREEIENEEETPLEDPLVLAAAQLCSPWEQTAIPNEDSLQQESENAVYEQNQDEASLRNCEES